MIKAPIPADEQERIASLRSLRILDTPGEERFDRLTRLASRIFEVPMAFVSLVDSERQWFKSACGGTDRETPRDISFCGHAIMGREPLIVTDARKDARFSDNPMVTGGPQIRFYAGQPVRGPGGHNIGSFCIVDRRPHEFDDSQVAVLQDLAGVVERELNLVDIIEVQRELIHAKEEAATAARERADALSRLVDSQAQLTRELSTAAAYVRSLLPDRLDGSEGVRTDWRFVPSSELGGDSFGYRWLDRDHFAMYLLDVCGHGVGTALLSVSAMEALRSGAIRDVDFKQPAAVLKGLNAAFPMERHNDLYFTVWYGVYDRSKRRLAYASAGHPPAILVSGPDPGHTGTFALNGANFMIGLQPGAAFDGSEINLDRHARLYVMSDGAYEIRRPDGTVQSRDDLVRELVAAWERGEPAVERALKAAQSAAAPKGLTDDFSLMEIVFEEARRA